MAAGGWPLSGAGVITAVLEEGAELRTSAGPPTGHLAVAVLLPLASPGDLRPATALTAAALASLPPGSTAGVSAVRRGVADLAAQWRRLRLRPVSRPLFRATSRWRTGRSSTRGDWSVS